MTKIERLQEVLEEVEQKGDEDHAAALQWAIFTLIQEGHGDDV